VLLGQSGPQSTAQPSATQQGGSTQNAGDQPANQNPFKIGILPFSDATGTGGSDTGKALSRIVQAEFTHSTNIVAYALDLGSLKQEDLDSQKAVAIGQDHHVDAVILATVL
jgi:hypothetical protein